MVLDLLFASSGLEREVCEAAERLEIVPGVAVPVARAGHLVGMKLLSRQSTGCRTRSICGTWRSP
jgi:hypothetical protein